MTVANKLKIRENMTLRTIGAPPDFEAGLGALPGGVKLSKTAKNFEQIHWFVKNKAEMQAGLPGIEALLTGDVLCWIYYPKGSSKIQTDLSRDKGWEELLILDLKHINLISFDDTWSAFGMKKKLEKEKGPDASGENEASTKEREIFKYVNPTTKKVKLPEDLATALKKNKPVQNYFDSLAFSHKKEYIEWIVTAKKEETRQRRIAGTLERLEKGWKNPSNN